MSARILARRPETLSALELLAAFDAQNRVTRAVGAFFADHDLLVTPTLGQLPAPHGTLRYDDPDHTVSELARHALRLRPVHRRLQRHRPARDQPAARPQRNGLPIGVQLVAPYGREDLLLRAATQLEGAGRRLTRKLSAR